MWTRWTSALSLSEISVLESAYALGAPTLGLAGKALLSRWNNGLRDEETHIRLMFLSWYSMARPREFTGLGDVDLPSTDALIAAFGGEEKLGAEALFMLAILTFMPDCLGNEKKYEGQRERLYAAAAAREPDSPLFRNWQVFCDSGAALRDPLIHIRPELRARFFGRGAMGEYVLHMGNHALNSKSNAQVT